MRIALGADHAGFALKGPVLAMLEQGSSISVFQSCEHPARKSAASSGPMESTHPRKPWDMIQSQSPGAQAQPS